MAVDKGTFHVNDKFSLDPRDGSYVLSIESPVPIFTIAVQVNPAPQEPSSLPPLRNMTA